MSPMAGNSAIEWTEATWNPVTGCDRVSPGCAHCYALDLAARLKRMGQPKYQLDGSEKSSGPGFGVTLHRSAIDTPLHWRAPRVIFVNSMSDLFHEAIPDEFIEEVFAVMAEAHWHVFQILTKRHERLLEIAGQPGVAGQRLDGGERGEPQVRSSRRQSAPGTGGDSICIGRASARPP